jgi:SAM-dependent methyltransferase
MGRDEAREFGNPSALAENRLFYKFADAGHTAYYTLCVHFGLFSPKTPPVKLNRAEQRLFLRAFRHQQTRLENVGRFIDAQSSPGLWLDVGCGSGQFLFRALKREGNRAVGTELDPEQLAAARELLEAAGAPPRFSLVCQPPDVLPFKDGAFDYVLSADVMEHVGLENQEAVLREMRRVLRPGGTLLLHTPNANRVRVTTVYKKAFYLLKGYNPFSIRHSFPKGHISLVSPKRLKRLAESPGFTVRVRYFGDTLSERLLSRAPLVRDVWSRSFVLLGTKAR